MHHFGSFFSQRLLSRSFHYLCFVILSASVLYFFFISSACGLSFSLSAFALHTPHYHSLFSLSLFLTPSSFPSSLALPLSLYRLLPPLLPPPSIFLYRSRLLTTLCRKLPTLCSPSLLFPTLPTPLLTLPIPLPTRPPGGVERVPPVTPAGEPRPDTWTTLLRPRARVLASIYVLGYFFFYFFGPLSSILVLE